MWHAIFDECWMYELILFFFVLAFTFCCTFCDGISVSEDKKVLFLSEVRISSCMRESCLTDKQLRHAEQKRYVKCLRVRKNSEKLRDILSRKSLTLPWKHFSIFFYSIPTFISQKLIWKIALAVIKEKKIHFWLLLPFQVVTNWHFNNFTIHYYSFYLYISKNESFCVQMDHDNGGLRIE